MFFNNGIWRLDHLATYLYREGIEGSCPRFHLGEFTIEKDNIAVDESYTNRTYEAFLEAVREVFNLDSERTFIPTEFTTYTQGRQQDVQAYLSIKMSLFKLACNSSERSFNTLLTHVIKGLHPVWRQVRRTNPREETSLRTAVIEATAAERDAYDGGCSEGTSAA